MTYIQRTLIAAGDAAVLVDDSGNRQFTLEVTRTILVSDCPARVGSFRPQSEKGGFLGLDVRATLARSVTGEVPGSTQVIFMPLVSQAFAAVNDAGFIDREFATVTAWGCYGEDQLAPAVVNPGQSVRGELVMDVPYGSGDQSEAATGYSALSRLRVSPERRCGGVRIPGCCPRRSSCHEGRFGRARPRCRTDGNEFWVTINLGFVPMVRTRLQWERGR